MSLTPFHVAFGAFLRTTSGSPTREECFAGGIRRERMRAAKICLDAADVLHFNGYSNRAEQCEILAKAIEAPADGGQPGE